jgi:N-acetylneuraminic acid mutarotase
MALNLSSWETCGAMPQPRAGCAVATEGDGIVVAGGTRWEDGRKLWEPRADRFIPATGAWEALAPLPRPIGEAAGVAFRGRVHVLGGGTADSISADVWCRADGGWERAGALPAPRRSAAAVVCGDEVVVVGGMTAGPTDYAAATSLVWRGDGRSWSVAAPMPGPARIGFAAGWCSGRLVVAGGYTAAGAGVANLDEILAYDPAADRWSVLGRLPVAVRGVGGLAWEGRGLLVFGGYTDAFSRRIFSVDPVSGAVAEAGELPVGLADGRFVRCGDRVVALTGEDGMKMRWAACVRSAGTEHSPRS